MDRRSGNGMLDLSAMVSNSVLLCGLVTCLVTCGCAGGDAARSGETTPAAAAPSPLAQVAEGSSTASDLDRIMAEHPESANTSELAGLRQEVEGQERAAAQTPDIDAYERHDRRLKRDRRDPEDQVILGGPTNKHDRFADDKAAQARYEFTWQPMRVDLPTSDHQGQ